MYISFFVKYITIKKNLKNQSKLICSLDTCLLVHPNASHGLSATYIAYYFLCLTAKKMYTLASIHVKSLLSLLLSSALSLSKGSTKKEKKKTTLH